MLKKWWFKLLCVGTLIRILLMPTTFHPDIWAFASAAHFFAYEGVINIYDHLINLPSSHPLVQNIGVGDFFIYPPLYYYIEGLFRLITRPLTMESFMPMVWVNNALAYAYPTFHWHLFIFKLPYLFVDIAAGFFLASLFRSGKKKAFTLWMFNPLSLYATFMMGQLDILPVFFTILTLYLAKRKNYGWAAVCLGIGGSFKMYPLLLVLPAAFVFGKNARDKIKYTFLGFLPYILTILPFINSVAFRQMVLFNPKNQKMLFMGLNVSGAEVVYPFLFLLTIIYLHAYYAKVKYDIGSYFLMTLLLLLSVTHYHPQWFLWTTPFFIMFLVKSRMKYMLLVFGLFVCWLVITLLFEASLSYGLFSPLWPNLAHAQPLSVWLKYFDEFQIKSIMRSVFAGISIYITHIITKDLKFTHSE